MAWLAVSTPRGIVGLSDGKTLAPHFAETDFSSFNGTPMATIAVGSIVEGDSGQQNFAFDIVLNRPSDLLIDVHFELIDGSAVSGSDYHAFSGSRRFFPGDTHRTIHIPIFGDTVPEIDETFTVKLTSASNAVLGDTEAVLTIINDDGPILIPPDLMVSDAHITEGDNGVRQLSFAVTLSSAHSQAVTFKATTHDGSATAGQDYQPLVDQLFTIASGQMGATVNVDITGDTDIESDEVFTLTLSQVTAANLINGTATGTILNDDLPLLLQISVSDISIVEGDSGRTKLVFTIRLSQPVDGIVDVGYEIVAGTATHRVDFYGYSGTRRFFAGVTETRVSVSVYGDTAVEGDETFELHLTSVTPNAVIVDPLAIGTILDDDD